MKDDKSILCIATSLKDAYYCLWRYKWNHIFISLIAFLPFTLIGLLGLFDPFFLPRASDEIVPDGYNLSFILYIATTYLWAIPCVILWHRLYLLGPEHLLRRKIWPILTRSFVLISKVLFLVGVFAILAILLITILSMLISFLGLNDSVSDFLELTDSEFMRFVLVTIFVGLVTYLFFLRFSLAISARTIGKKIGFLTSWRLTEKNTLRMFISFMAIFVPTVALSFIIVYIYQWLLGIDLFYSGKILSAMSYIHIFILAPVITLPLSATCSQCASFYRHCGGEDCNVDL